MHVIRHAGCAKETSLCFSDAAVKHRAQWPPACLRDCRARRAFHTAGCNRSRPVCHAGSHTEHARKEDILNDLDGEDLDILDENDELNQVIADILEEASETSRLSQSTKPQPGSSQKRRRSRQDVARTLTTRDRSSRAPHASSTDASNAASEDDSDSYASDGSDSAAQEAEEEEDSDQPAPRGLAFKAALRSVEWPAVCEHIAQFAATMVGRQRCQELEVGATLARTQARPAMRACARQGMSAQSAHALQRGTQWPDMALA